MTRLSHLGSSASIAIGLTLLVTSSIFFGIEFTDSGFIQGISWAIHSGGTLYEDIDYVRPPVSPFIWQAVFLTGLTDGLELLFRSLVTLEKALTAFFVGAICLRHGIARSSPFVDHYLCLSGPTFAGHALAYSGWSFLRDQHHFSVQPSQGPRGADFGTDCGGCKQSFYFSHLLCF